MYLSCPRKFYLRYIKRLRTRPSIYLIRGLIVHKTLHEFNPSKIIIGAGGITEEKGLTNYEFLSSTYVKEMVKLVKEVIVVADHSKFGRIVLTNMMPLKDVSAIVTDSGISPKFVKIFRKYSIKYKIAKVTGPK